MHNGTALNSLILPISCCPVLYLNWRLSLLPLSTAGHACIRKQNTEKPLQMEWPYFVTQYSTSCECSYVFSTLTRVKYVELLTIESNVLFCGSNDFQMVRARGLFLILGEKREGHIFGWFGLIVADRGGLKEDKTLSEKKKISFEPVSDSDLSLLVVGLLLNVLPSANLSLLSLQAAKLKQCFHH